MKRTRAKGSGGRSEGDASEASGPEQRSLFGEPEEQDPSEEASSDAAEGADRANAASTNAGSADGASVDGTSVDGTSVDGTSATAPEPSSTQPPTDPDSSAQQHATAHQVPLTPDADGPCPRHDGAEEMAGGSGSGVTDAEPPSRPVRSGTTVGGPRRVFLGWERPLLEVATEWLMDEVGGSGFGFGFGLPGTTVVVPGRRAGRLLLDRLTQAAKERGHGAILPPEILTVGALPERILEVAPAASEGTLRVARAARLRQACNRPGPTEQFVADALEAALGGRPEGDDWNGWVEVAQRLEDVAVRLEAVGLPLERAARRVERMSGGVFAESGGESERWQAWREVDHWLAKTMEAARLPSRSQQRFDALSAGRLHDLGDLPDRLVLVGLAEVSPMIRELLDAAYGDSGSRADGGGVDCLVHAPRSIHERFDRYGCPRPEAWSLRDGPLVQALERDGVSTAFVERPADQVGDALAWVVDSLGRSSAEQGTPASDESVDSGSAGVGPTVGVGDELSAERVVQGLASRGVSAHAPDSRALDVTEPGRCLLLLTGYSIHGGLARLMQCLAVPAIHRWVDEVLHCSVRAEGPPESSVEPRTRRALEGGDLVAFVDAVGVRGIAGRPPEQLEPEARRVLDHIEAAVRVLVAPAEAFEAFDGDVGRLVEAVVDPDVELDVAPARGDLGAHASHLLETLRRLASVPIAEERAMEAEGSDGTRGSGETADDAGSDFDLREWERVATTLQDAESVEHSSDLRLDEVARTLLEQPDRAAEADPRVEVEVVGWLELAFDPSSRIVVLDLNEGKVPSRPESDPILPDSTLATLGGPGDADRLARDAFLLAGLANSRRELRLLACRRDESGEPLLPSRLLLAGAGPELAGRVVAAFGEGNGPAEQGTALSTRLWLHPGGGDDQGADFEPVRPPTDAAALEAYASRLRRLRVTDFRAFLSCPYRFFLRRLLGAEPARPWPLELDAPSFGTFVHEVLRRFGRGDGVDLEDAELVLERLRRVADGLARSSFGLDPPLSVAIQLEHLDRRFEAFARWQAAHRAAGWRTVKELTERDVSLELIVDDQAVEIVGRIDRVDRHPDQGYLLLDYKTGDRPVEASSARTIRSGVWSDLQLPLYREIARARRDLFVPGVPVRTGLVRVSKQVGARPLSTATWSEEDYGDALEAARGIVRSMRQGAFWPPSAPPRYADGFEWAAGDRLVGWKPTDSTGSESVSGDAGRSSPGPSEGQP